MGNVLCWALIIMGIIISVMTVILPLLQWYCEKDRADGYNHDILPPLLGTMIIAAGLGLFWVKILN